TAPVVPDYYSQVAAHMISVGENAPFSGKYRQAMKSAFVRRGILSLQAAATVTSVAPVKSVSLPSVAAVSASARQASVLPWATNPSRECGLRRNAVKGHAAEEPKRLPVTSAALRLGPVEPRSPQNAAESFTEDLFQRGRVDIGVFAHPESGLGPGLASKT